MGRKRVGEGSVAMSISFPQEMARQLEAHSNRSEVVVAAMNEVGGKYLDIDFSKLEEQQERIFLRHMKKHIRQAVKDALEELEALSLEDLLNME